MKKSTRVKMGVAGTSLLLAIGTLDAFWAGTDGASPTDGKVLYGISRDSGQLFRYDFDTQSPSNVGVITDADGSTMTGIDASASIPGHQNIYGFWTDPDQGLVHLVYINSESATGTAVGDDLGPGHITGAVAAKTEYFSSDVDDDDDDHDGHGDDDDDHEDDDDDHDRGHGNDDDGIDHDNPGHSSGVNDHGQNHGAHDGDDDDDHAEDHDDDHDDHADDHDDDDHDEHGDDDDHDDEDDDHDQARTEFSLGWSIFAVQTREADLDDDDDHDDHGDHGDDDDDHEDDDDDHDRGHGNDDDGIDDDNPGHSSGVNEHGQGHGAHDGDDDGHDDDDHADHDDDDHDEHGDDDDHEDDDDHDDDHESASATGYRLIQVDHRSGEVTEMMTLSREYDGLATTDGITFMGTSGSDLYRIDPIARTETLVGSTGLDEMFGLEFTDSTLIGFENVGDRLLPVDMTTGSQLGSPVNIGTTNLGTIIFMDASADPANNSDSYD